MNKIFYINLDSREDRKKLCEDQLNTLGWKYERFPAVNSTNGAIGCAMSHLQILKKARDNNLPYVMIFEDDFEITDYKLFKTQFKKILSDNVSFDVLKFGANPFPPYKYIKDTHVGLNISFTTHGYMVKQHYYDKLIKNFEDSVNTLLKEGRGPNGFNCCDVRMNILSQKDTWILLTPICCRQRAGYSDIENKTVEYNACDTLKLDNSIRWLDSKSCNLVDKDKDNENYVGTIYDKTEYEYWCIQSEIVSKRLKNLEKTRVFLPLF